MKTGKTLNELAQSLVHLKQKSRDFMVPTSELRAQVDSKDNLRLEFDGNKFQPNAWTHGQLASYTNVPKQYYDRLNKENTSLLSDNINWGLSTKGDESRLIRTIDGKARALLSSRYRILDSYDLFEAVYPTLERLGMDVVASEITEQRMYIKCLSKTLKSEVLKGDVVQRGIVISTSDVGSGSLKVEPLIYRLVCQNGMIANTAFKKYHVGRNQHEDSVQELLSERTKHVSDVAFWLQVRDIVSNSMRPELFNSEVAQLYNAAMTPIKTDNISKVVELSMKSVGITGDRKKESILSQLATGNQGAGLTLYGLANSYTAVAKSDEFSWEESIELERAGGAIIELNKSAWRALPAAA